MNQPVPAFLQDIAAARSLPHLAPDERLTEFGSLADLLDQRSVEMPEQECLVFLDESGNRRAWSYADFTADARRVAEWLTELGIERGDRIATVSGNHAETVLQYFGAWLIGVIVVPVNVAEDDDRIGFILADSQAKLAFVREPYLERIAALRALSDEHLPDLATLVVCEGEAAGHHSEDERCGSDGPARRRAVAVAVLVDANLHSGQRTLCHAPVGEDAWQRPLDTCSSLC